MKQQRDTLSNLKHWIFATLFSVSLAVSCAQPPPSQSVPSFEGVWKLVSVESTEPHTGHTAVAKSTFIKVSANGDVTGVNRITFEFRDKSKSKLVRQNGKIIWVANEPNALDDKSEYIFTMSEDRSEIVGTTTEDTTDDHGNPVTYKISERYIRVTLGEADDILKKFRAGRIQIETVLNGSWKLVQKDGYINDKLNSSIKADEIKEMSEGVENTKFPTPKAIDFGKDRTITLNNGQWSGEYVYDVFNEGEIVVNFEYKTSKGSTRTHRILSGKPELSDDHTTLTITQQQSIEINGEIKNVKTVYVFK